jgi:hypothetical protein
MFPSLINAVREHDRVAAVGGGGQSLSQNPFMTTLSGLLSSGTGTGSLGVYGSLFSPFMGPNLQRSYQSILENAYSGGMDQFRASGSRQTPTYGGNDWWKYIFGY